MSFVTPVPTATPPSVAASMRAAAAATPSPAPPSLAPAPDASTPSASSTTVTLSPQAQSLAASHPSSSSSSSSSSAAAPAPAPHETSIYESIKHGIEEAVTDVGDAIAGGAHAVVDGVETTLSTIHDVAKGTLELPFAVVSKVCDGVGSLIDAV